MTQVQIFIVTSAKEDSLKEQEASSNKRKERKLVTNEIPP
jgi:hypothetical protein